MERRTFEESLRDAFKDAEAIPSEKVWTNVELELEKERGGAMRRSLAFYQMLAAAAVSIALLSTGVAYFMINDKNNTIEQLVARSKESGTGDANGAAIAQGTTENIASNSSPNPSSSTASSPSSSSSSSSSSAAPSSSNSTSPSSAGQRNNPRGNASDATPSSGNSVASAQGYSDSDTGENQAAKSSENPGKVISGTVLASDATVNANGSISDDPSVENESGVTRAAGITIVEERALPSFYTAAVRPLSFQQTTADPVALMMSKLAEQEMLLASADDQRQKKESTQEKVWTALGVAAGGFSAVSHSTAAAPQSSMGLGFASMNNSSVADKQSKASGVAYSLGLSFGTKVATRWVVQGGLNYLTQSSNYVATNVIASPNYTTLQAESINALGKLPALADAKTADRLAPTVPYSVNNSLKYFSLPVQAGYLLVNRKFGVQLNAGISTDLFLENTITPEGGSLDKTTQSSGSDSPYRTVNFSGLMGTEFSYRLGQRYRIALNPALRYPLNSVYKSDVGIESAPLTFDVGLRFRYIFK